MKAYKKRVVEISRCCQCPNHVYGMGIDTCLITRKRVSRLNCTPFPKTCPLQEGEEYVVRKDSYGNRTIGRVPKEVKKP